MKSKTRKPNVAGSFYTDDPLHLANQLKSFLDMVPPEKETDHPYLGFIAPHAGFTYSGQTAAYVYKIVEQLNPENIIIIGPSHYAYFNGISIDTMNYYQTPLGTIEINADIREKIAAQSKTFNYNQSAHSQEHSLEVQLPFIQIVAPKAKIIPIIIGNISYEEITETANILASIMKNNEKTILIASTDFSHFHHYNKALEMDHKAIDHIVHLDIMELVEDYNAKKIEMCGFIPAIVTIFALENLGYTNVTILKYENSGDVTGDHNSVVGYGALAISKNPVSKSELSSDEKKYLLKLARNTIRGQLRIPQDELPPSPAAILKQKRGAFVSLHKKGRLRGCIGYIQPIKSLEHTIKEMAISAAFQDNRFPPIETHEELEIDIEISVLSPIEEITDHKEIEVGKHGLIVKQGGYSGLLLPQVATEWNWDREEFLRQTCCKAGLPYDAWEKGAQIFCFTASIFNESMFK